MKNSLTLLITIGLLFSASLAFSQKIPSPTHVVWKVDGKEVSLKDAYKGVNSPEKLTFELFFTDADAKKIKDAGTEIEFKWYYYYATSREYMDSYTVTYDESKTDAFEQKRIASSRSDISKGWWEVHVVASGSEDKITFNDIKQFQIFIK